MTEADSLRSFTTAVLQDVGAEVRDDGTFLWIALPESAQMALDLPAQACLTLDPEHTGQFDAELVAPGSYLLEKLLGIATKRGRWDVARLTGVPDDWALQRFEVTAVPSTLKSWEVSVPREAPLVLFAFRAALTSDEKRESFHLVAATLDGQEAWPVEWPVAEDGLVPASLPGFAPDLAPAYRRACEVLQDRLRGDLEAFEKSSLAALEEEVRRIFRYFDGTVAEVHEAAPSGAEDVVRAIEAERDRRLAEALERFEPHAVASLCSVRVVLAPTARIVGRGQDGEPLEARLDALTRVVRGIPDRVKGGGSAPPRDRPPSDTPPRRTTAGPTRARSPRGSRARSQSSASRRRST